MSGTATAELVITFRRETNTKNKVRFGEVVEPGAREIVRTLYIGKPEHAQLGSPEELRVTVEPVG